MQIYKITQTRLAAILRNFLHQRRSFIFALRKLDNLNIKSFSINFDSHLVVPQLFLTLKYYWENNTIVRLTVPLDRQVETIALIKMLSQLDQYFLVIELVEPISKYILLTQQNQVETFEVNTEKQLKQKTVKESEPFYTLKNIMSQHMSFKKARSNDKAIAETFQNQFSEITTEIYALTAVHNKTAKFTNDLIKYIDTLMFISEQNQISFLHGKIIKWRTFDLLSNYELSKSQ